MLLHKLIFSNILHICCSVEPLRFLPFSFIFGLLMRGISTFSGGRLPMTWYPRSYVDLVPMTNTKMRPDPSKGQPGQTYRFYRGKTVYHFGFGLSYTSYVHRIIKGPKILTIPLNHAHSCHSKTCKAIDAADSACNGLVFDIELVVTNIGKMAGSHSVLLFSSPPMIFNAPKKELVDFKKVWLAPRQRSLVSFKVNVCKHLSVVDEDGNRKVPLGRYLLQVGDTKLNMILKI